MKKKIISLLVLTALALSVFSGSLVLTGVAEDVNVLYFNDFDTSYDAGEWETVSGVAYQVERKMDEETGNGVLQVSLPSGTGTVELNKTIQNTAANKPKLLFEYRFRFAQNGGWNGYTSLGQKDLYNDQTRHCHAVFNDGGSISNTVFDMANVNDRKQIGTINGANVWNTISVLYDNIENKRTVFINGAAGEEIASGNTWSASGMFNICLKAGIRDNVPLEFDYIRIAACPESFDYTPSGSDGAKVDLTFNSLPDPGKMIPANFTVDGASVVAVERNYEKPNTYTLGFETPLAAGNYTVTADAAVTSADGTPVSTEAKSFAAVPKAPAYTINYLYNYNFIAGENRSGFTTTPGDGAIEIKEEEGYLRMTGVEGDPFAGAAVPQIAKNQGSIAGNPNVVLEFRYRTDGFNTETDRLQPFVNYGNAPGVCLYHGGVHTAVRANTADTSKKVADAANGEWHNVSIIYNGTKQERTILVDGEPMKTTTDGNGTAGTEYGNNQTNTIFAFQWRGYFRNINYVDFDYIRAYTYPEFSMKLPKEEGVSAGGIDVDFSYFPDVSTLTNANISVKEAGTEKVVTTAGNPVSNGTVRQYTLAFDELLMPNTAYDITLDVKDIDGRPLSITKTFTTGDPMMEIGELFIDKSDLSAVTASFTAVNQTAASESGVLTVAAYTVENGVEKMNAMASKNVLVAANSGKVTYTTDSIDVSALEGDVKIRAFLWSGDNNLTPLKPMKEE
ncbi:hypothetical protein [Acetivibrio sp. MSJd-27]|uniref:hypothetical protein n=1 Tax=Acetivibrio sp. MSJd-27 TaxID=2841523 RepID=UPI001C10D0AD|nr:hypothetical protein [Acetivibrio sp. MSJd-27]MBU5449490.1 hypothetical protein [Acetivibrio sp. MSJd-27]